MHYLVLAIPLGIAGFLFGTSSRPPFAGNAGWYLARGAIVSVFTGMTVAYLVMG